MGDNNWHNLDSYQTRYWSIQLPAPAHMTRIAIAQERITDQKYPYLLVFNENINPDHWFGGRRRFGHGHQVKMDLFYFEPDGNGNFLTGEELRWLPHYGDYTSLKKEALNLDDITKKAINSLPNKDLFISVLKSEQNFSINEKEIFKRTGVPLEVLFERYQDPSILAEEKESILQRRRDCYKEGMGPLIQKVRASFKRSVSVSIEGEQIPINLENKQEIYEPKFDLTKPSDKLEYLLRILKKASGFDVYNAPEPFMDNGLEGAGLGMFGMAPFPGPIDFLEGSDIEDGGVIGDTGLSNIAFPKSWPNITFSKIPLIKDFPPVSDEEKEKFLREHKKDEETKDK